MTAPEEGLHRFELAKAHRLLKRSEFLRVQAAAVRVHDPDFVLLVHRRDPPDAIGARLGLVAARKVGSAVARNRAKRLVREWFRHSRTRVAADVDLVVILKSGAPNRGRELWTALERALGDGLARAFAPARAKKKRGRARPRGAAGDSG